jgi:hypothetical protein
MTIELAKQLRDADFPFGISDISFPSIDPIVTVGQEKFIRFDDDKDTWYLLPTLSELIAACGDSFGILVKETHPEHLWEFHARKRHGDYSCWGLTPEEAVARLWLALNKKS